MKYICKYLLSLLAFIILNNSYSKQNIIQNIRTSDKPDKLTTRIVLDLSHKTAYSVFILDNKPRLVIDLEANESRKSFDLKSKLSASLDAASLDAAIIHSNLKDKFLNDIDKAYIKSLFGKCATAEDDIKAAAAGGS